MKNCISMIYVLLFVMNLSAQDDSVKLNADFMFEDGIYYSFESLIQNQADLSWVGIDGEMVELAGTMRVQIAGFGYEGKELPQAVYAICLDGKPYVFVKNDERLDYHEFAGLQELGYFGYFEYRDLVKRGRKMYAYNPTNGQPFREGYVESERMETLRWCIDMTTGRRFQLERPELLLPLSDEPELIRAISQLDTASPDFYDRLLQAIVRFNERHPVYFPRPTLNR